MAVVPPCTHLHLVSPRFITFGSNTREKGIQNALPSQEGMVGGVFLLHGSRSADGPQLHHGMPGGFSFKIGFQHDILERGSMKFRRGIKSTHINRITSFLGDVGDRAQGTRRKHDFMAVYKRVFINATENIPSRDVVSDLEIEGCEIPLV